MRHPAASCLILLVVVGAMLPAAGSAVDSRREDNAGGAAQADVPSAIGPAAADERLTATRGPRIALDGVIDSGEYGSALPVLFEKREAAVRVQHDGKNLVVAVNVTDTHLDGDDQFRVLLDPTRARGFDPSGAMRELVVFRRQEPREMRPDASAPNGWAQTDITGWKVMTSDLGLTAGWTAEIVVDGEKAAIVPGRNTTHGLAVVKWDHDAPVDAWPAGAWEDVPDRWGELRVLHGVPSPSSVVMDIFPARPSPGQQVRLTFAVHPREGAPPVHGVEWYLEIVRAGLVEWRSADVITETERLVVEVVLGPGTSLVSAVAAPTRFSSEPFAETRDSWAVAVEEAPQEGTGFPIGSVVAAALLGIAAGALAGYEMASRGTRSHAKAPDARGSRPLRGKTRKPSDRGDRPIARTEAAGKG